ncbi:hypothetical protein ACLKA6_018737 [Drosophila palustris]
MYENEQNEEGGSQPPQDSNQPQRSPSIQDSDEDSKSEEVLTLEKRIKDLEKSFEQTLQMNNKLQKTLEEHEYLQRSLQNRPTGMYCNTLSNLPLSIAPQKPQHSTLISQMMLSMPPQPPQTLPCQPVLPPQTLPYQSALPPQTLPDQSALPPQTNPHAQHSMPPHQPTHYNLPPNIGQPVNNMSQHGMPIQPYIRKLQDLPEFSGLPEQWPMFIIAFKETTNAYKYTNLENLTRLQKALTGAAKNLVAALLIYPSNNSSPVMEPIREHNLGLNHFLSADPTPGREQLCNRIRTEGFRRRDEDDATGFGSFLLVLRVTLGLALWSFQTIPYDAPSAPSSRSRIL